MSLRQYLKQARERTLDRYPLASHWSNILYSGTTLTLWSAASGPTRNCSKGLVLDAGSGRGGWREVIARGGGVRESVDIVERPGESLTWIADLAHMKEVPDNRYDCVICHQVLEHVQRPWQALEEIVRVLKPGGAFVTSVPHLSRLHDLPHDYFRYTPNGLASLLEACGLELVDLEPYGGVFCFLHHQVATVIFGLAAVFRPLYLLCAVINAPVTLLVVALDSLLELAGRMPNGVVAMARKPT